MRIIRISFRGKIFDIGINDFGEINRIFVPEEQRMATDAEIEQLEENGIDIFSPLPSLGELEEGGNISVIGTYPRNNYVPSPNSMSMRRGTYGILRSSGGSSMATFNETVSTLYNQIFENTNTERVVREENDDVREEEPIRVSFDPVLVERSDLDFADWINDDEEEEEDTVSGEDFPPYDLPLWESREELLEAVEDFHSNMSHRLRWIFHREEREGFRRSRFAKGFSPEDFREKIANTDESHRLNNENSIFLDWKMGDTNFVLMLEGFTIKDVECLRCHIIYVPNDMVLCYQDRIFDGDFYTELYTRWADSKLP